MKFSLSHTKKKYRKKGLFFLRRMSLNLSTHKEQHTTTYNSTFKRSESLFWPPHSPHIHEYMYKNASTHIYINKNNYLKNKLVCSQLRLIVLVKVSLADVKHHNQKSSWRRKNLFDLYFHSTGHH